MVNIRTKAIASIMLASVFSLAFEGTASANVNPAPIPDPVSESESPIDSVSLPVVTSESGISALQLTPPGASPDEIDRAIAAYEMSESARNSASNGEVGPLATGDYYSYCQEGAGGMMVWTHNKPSNCYGWYYEYLDGYRVSKVNMLRLMADNGPGASLPDLNAWCDNNSFYCNIATGLITIGVGMYLGLLMS